jgi:dnd system-associated protein 4
VTDLTKEQGRAPADTDRFYVQLDKHPLFQAWGKDDAESPSPLPTLKDAFVFAASLGWANERRVQLVKRQHVGFWRSFDSRDAAILQGIAIAETGDPAVVANQGEVIRIAEEYANGGIDLLQAYDRSDTERTLVALAGLVFGTERPADGSSVPKDASTAPLPADEELVEELVEEVGDQS